MDRPVFNVFRQHMKKSNSVPSASRLLYLTLGSLLVIGVLLAIAQEFRIRQASLDTASNEFTVSQETRQDSYYILYKGEQANQLDLAVTMKLGTGQEETLIDPSATASASFYRVFQVAINQPGDTDGDGIDDVFELLHPTILNGLNNADAALDSDGDGISNLDEYLNGTDPTVPENLFTAALANPAAGSTYTAPLSLELIAETEGTITLVEFFSNNNKLGEDREPPYTFDWNDIAVGEYSVTVRATNDEGETTNSPPVAVTVNIPSPVITTARTPTSEDSIQLQGTALPNSQIEVEGALTPLNAQAAADGSFSVEVNLRKNRLNRLFVTALSNGRNSPRTPFEIIQDEEPPFLFIDFPADGTEMTTDTAVIAGRVGDMLSGFMGLNVAVNGQPANVIVGIGQNGTFERTGVPLQDGDNVITATATDEHGNSVTKSITLKRVPLTGPSMVAISGDGQKAVTDTILQEPVLVQVNSGTGNPLPNKVVTFKVTRSNGRVSTDPAFVAEGALSTQVRTDANGRAQVYWKLGTDAGCGNNRITVTSKDIAGSVFFCASADPKPARQINIGSGHNQRGEAGAPAPLPLRVWVSDACNGVEGIPVTFSVVQGNGSFDGNSSVVVNSSRTGHAEAIFTLGATAGNNVVRATFEGNQSEPAMFTLFGVQRKSDTPTSFTGIVLNNSSQPVGGARVSIEVGGSTLPHTFSLEDGTFTFTDVPAGPGHLRVDGLPATTLAGQPIPQGSFPALAYEILVVPNTVNSLSTPVLLPSLNPNNARLYDGTKNVHLHVEGMEGLRMTIQAGSMTLADGTRPSPSEPAVVALNQVNHDDIPMPMPDGAAPPFAWTLQPAGAQFDPPVSIQYPNMSGLPAGGIAYFLSFNHDTEQFNIVATGHVTDDSTCVVTDPGTGISVAGWGCNCPPYSVTGSCEGKGGGGGGASILTRQGAVPVITRSSDFGPFGANLAEPIVPVYHQAPLFRSAQQYTLGPANSAEATLRSIDTDGDGVPDVDEKSVYGTDPQLTDTDGDGYSDREEVETRHTNPGQADDLQWQTVLSLPGIAGAAVAGEWSQEGNLQFANTLKGALEFSFEISASQGRGTYRLLSTLGRRREDVSAHKNPWTVKAYVDGEYVGKAILRFQLFEPYQEVEWLTPFLQPGPHTLELVWENVHEGRSLAVHQVELQSAAPGRPEAFASWQQDRLDRMAYAQLPAASSHISPVTIEGKAVHLSMTRLSTGQPLLRGDGHRWYANLPLNREGETEYSVSFQNNGKSQTHRIRWEPLNLLQAKEVSLRIGDTLKMAADSQENAAGNATVHIHIYGETLTTSIGAPLFHTFEHPGETTIRVVAQFSNGKVETNYLKVKIYALPVPSTEPALWLGRHRTWTWEKLSSDIALEHRGIELTELDSEGSGRRFLLQRDDADREAYLVARLGAGGPVLGRIPVHAFWLRAVVQGHLETTTLPDGTMTAENELFSSSLPNDVQVVIRIINSGVVLDDGSAERILAPEDFDADGRYSFALLKPSDVLGSVCHQILAYQDGQLIGKR